MKLREPRYISKKEILKRVKEVISDKVGIIQKVIEIPRSISEPLVFSTSCHLCNTSAFIENKCFERHGGAGFSQEDALISGVSEALERYCSAFYTEENLIFSSYNNLKKSAINPEQFVLFSDEQYRTSSFPFSRFCNDTVINWTKGFSLITEKEVLVPAQIVFMPYNYRKNESLISYSSSTGLSCRTSLEEAILYGLYETIERDAFTIFWMSRPNVTKLNTYRLKTLAPLFDKRYNLPNWKHYVCNITSDITVPTFFTLSLGYLNFGSAVCVGASCNLSSTKAISKSLLESAQATSFLLYQFSKEKKTYRNDFSDVIDFDDHGEFYSRMPKFQTVFNFIKNSNNYVNEQELEELSSNNVLLDLNNILKILQEKGMDVIVVDLTTSDVKSLGFFVVKVIVPQLIPLHGNYNFPFKGSKRLLEVPKKIWAIDLRYENLNPYPHPFP